MGIKRGSWNEEKAPREPTVRVTKFGARPAPILAEGKSNSEARGVGQGNAYPAPELARGISDHRKAELQRATYSQGTSSGVGQFPLVVFSNSYKKSQEIQNAFSINKTASTSSIGGSTGANTIRQAPEIYSPLLQMANLQLPRDRITMNAWNRNFYDTHPLVHNCINLHATYPIGKINIKCKHKKVEQFFNDMAEEINLIGILQAVALEFWKMGEVFPYAELSPEKGCWKSIEILNPDFVHIKAATLSGEPVISLKPDQALLKLIMSNSPSDVQLREKIDPEILYHVKKGENIPLDSFHVSHLMMKASPYDTRGTSPIVSIYKDLMLYDKLRESKFAQADNLVNPITLVKVGGTAEGEYHPTQEALDQWRQTFETAQYDKDFKIISHAGVTVERVGASGSIIDISGDMTFILDNILFGLMVPKSVLTQEGATFASASVGLEVLKQRYESFRTMIAQWLVRKIFAPISEINEFYDYQDGEKKLIVPEVDWNHMILYDMDNYINILNTLANNPQNPMVSKSTLFRSLGLSLEDERRKIKEEMIYNIIVAKEQAVLQEMSLSALRAIKSDDDIIEPTEQMPLPGTPGSEEAGIPGAGGPPPMGGGLDLGLGMPPGGGLGAPPPMGGPPMSPPPSPGGALSPPPPPPPPTGGPGGPPPGP